jgi:hypothetical protein
VFNSIKPVGAYGEGSKHCIVPAYGESKLKDRDNIDACLTTNANRLSQTRKSGYGMRRGSPTLSRDDGGLLAQLDQSGFRLRKPELHLHAAVRCEGQR